MATEIQHFINGRLVPGKSGKFAPVFNPATGEQTGSVPLAGEAEQDPAKAHPLTYARKGYAHLRATVEKLGLTVQ